MKKKTLTTIVIVAIILGSIYYLSRIAKPLTTGNNTPTSPVTENINPQPTIDNSDLRAGGSSYLDSQGVYALLYPADYKLDTQDKQHIRIYKTGATQKGQTEIYDGAMIVIEVVDLQRKSLQEWGDNHLKKVIADGTSEIIEPKKSMMLNNYPGFTYKIRGLGEATNYVLQKDILSNYAILITTSVNDPQNVGFQKEVDKTLSTLEILK
ncbi:MAG: hypothetical protein Q7T54_03255 [Candidatus Levybacteria bacterium]|nr:hypothetical protein [Candidatus Levybacteria bacterium]